MAVSSLNLKNNDLAVFMTGASDIDSGWLVPDGQWSHIAFSYYDVLNQYGNGVLRKSGNYGNALVSSTVPLRIDGQQACPSCFNGQIDDVRVYNYVLTPLQMKLLYNDNSAVVALPDTYAGALSPINDSLNLQFILTMFKRYY